MIDMRLLPLLTVLLLAFGLMACDTVIDDTIDPIDSAADADLNNPDEVNFLVNGIRARGNNVHENITVQSSLMSDQFIFGGAHGGGATFPTFRDIMRGLPADTNPLNNNSVDGTQNHLGQYRFLADNLLRRVENLGAEAFGGEDDERYQQALFTGNFHGALARYYWATYFSDLPGTDATGGGVISDLENPADPERSEFLQADQLYDDAITRLDAAAAFASDYEVRVINSVKARIALFRNNASQAATFAADGLEPGDAPFQNEFVDRSGNQQNTWHTQGGIGRAQTVPAPRFFYAADYLNRDFAAAESGRIPLLDPGALGIAADFGTVTEAGLANREAVHPLRVALSGVGIGDEILLPLQGRYDNRGSDIDFISWQEMHLIRAEDAERSGDSGTAQSLINEVRDSYGIAPLASYDGMNTIFVERDKEMFTTGIRLVDQRRATRFGLDAEGLDLDVHGWHLSNDVWWYLPITLAERLNNPNLPNELP